MSGNNQAGGFRVAHPALGLRLANFYRVRSDAGAAVSEESARAKRLRTESDDGAGEVAEVYEKVSHGAVLRAVGVLAA